MKIIGITGKGGTGKTTFSNMLIKDNKSEIIHMDYILDEIKSSKLISPMTQKAVYIENKNQEHRIINEKLSNKIYKTKFILDIYLKIRKKIINSILNNKINELKNKGIETIIVEGIDLSKLDVLYDMDYLILMTAPYNERLQRVIKRDGIFDKEIFVKKDLKSQRNIIGKISKKIDKVIENNGTIEELQTKAEELEQDIKFIKSNKEFREKYKTNVFNKMINISHRREKNEYDKEFYKNR